MNYQYFLQLLEMFKPSLRRSLLNDKLFLQLQNTKTSFNQQPQINYKPVQRFRQYNQTHVNMEIPSMLIPQQMLQKNVFHKNNNFTDVFTPLSYDFKPYPHAIKQIIKANPKSAQTGRIGSLNYIIYEKVLGLWSNSDKDGQTSSVKIHKFQQKIQIVQFSKLRNTNLFINPQVIVMALCFGNRITLYKIQQVQLNLQDLMLRYKLRNCTNIQKIKFTEQNQLIFGGDSGQISMISFNKQKQLTINIKSSLLKKYFSTSSFDYFTRHSVKDIEIGNNYIYCLKDKISKSSYIMYCIKNAMNKFIKLSQTPKYIHLETFIDIYKFQNKERKSIIFIDQIKQKQVERKVKQGYLNFWGEGVSEPFKIISVHTDDRCCVFIDKQQNALPQQKVIISPKLILTTKCGYLISIVHEGSLLQPQNSMVNQNRQNFSFFDQPIKLPSLIGQTSLFQAKTFLSNDNSEKYYRKNYMVGSYSSKPQQFMFLFNDCLMYKNELNLSVIKFDDLKKNVSQTTTFQQFFMHSTEFQQKYQKTTRQRQFGGNQQSSNIFASIPNQNKSKQYYKLFNNQKRWTVFDNEGRFHIYHLQVKHLILVYLYYQCQFSSQYQNFQVFPSSSSSSNSMIESDWKIHSVIQKLIKIYGYCTFIKSLLEILSYNSQLQREYFYLQKEIFIQIVKNQFQFYLPNKFEDWNYNISQHNQANKIVTTKKMLQLVWILLYEYQYKIPFNSQVIKTESTNSQYNKILTQYSQINFKLSYSAYGYALKSIFFDMISPLLNLRAKDFRLKQQTIKRCRKQIAMLFQFLQSKRKKSQTYQYRNYLSMKLKNLPNKKQQNLFRQYEKNNQTLSTNLSNLSNNLDDTIILNQNDERKNNSQQSNQTVQKLIYNSIKKINTLFDVMSILIEKDQRQGLPSFLEIVTNIKNQIKIGNLFFQQELFISNQTIEFVHPQLVRQVEITIPQFQLNKKIDYLKFKAVRNIAFDNNQITEIDLKSLDFDKLSSIVSSVQIPQLRKIFIGKPQDFTTQRIYFYNQFLSVCLSKLIILVRQFSTLKQKNFTTLASSKKSSLINKSLSSQISNLNLQKIIISNQKLQYYQQQMSIFYQQIKDVFQNFLKSIHGVSGSKYYECQKYLQKTIQVLIQNFGYQEILVQELEVKLRGHNLLDKIGYLYKCREKILITREKREKPILNVIQDKGFQFSQKTTFQILRQKKTQKLSNYGDQTLDTLRNNSSRHS